MKGFVEKKAVPKKKTKTVDMSRFRGYRSVRAFTADCIVAGKAQNKERALAALEARDIRLHEFVWECIENVNLLTNVELSIMTQTNAADVDLQQYFCKLRTGTAGRYDFNVILERLRVLRALLDRRIHDRARMSSTT